VQLWFVWFRCHNLCYLEFLFTNCWKVWKISVHGKCGRFSSTMIHIIVKICYYLLYLKCSVWKLNSLFHVLLSGKTFKVQGWVGLYFDLLLHWLVDIIISYLEDKIRDSNRAGGCRTGCRYMWFYVDSNLILRFYML